MSSIFSASSRMSWRTLFVVAVAISVCRLSFANGALALDAEIRLTIGPIRLAAARAGRLPKTAFLELMFWPKITR